MGFERGRDLDDIFVKRMVNGNLDFGSDIFGYRLLMLLCDYEMNLEDRKWERLSRCDKYECRWWWSWFFFEGRGL